MLDFPEEYFQEEIRDGFRISAMIKRAWAAQLEVLDKIIKVCEKYGLTYYAYWGTLLGAVRHHGFIPWDDDIDIAFRREDYKRFLDVAKDELPEEYCILSVYSEEEWDNSFMRVTNGHSIDVSTQRLSQYHGFPFVAGIDIYPLDYIPRDAKDAEVQRTLLGLIGEAVALLQYIEEQRTVENRQEDLSEYEETFEQCLIALEEYCNVTINRKCAINNQLLKIYDSICGMYGEKDGDILTSFPNYMKHFTYCVKKEWINQTLIVPFENIFLHIPIGYDEILKQSYSNYMTPIRKKAAHNYPFYKEQMKLMEKQGEKIEDVDKQRNDISEKNLCQLPLQWQKKLYYGEENSGWKRKKIILYCTTVDNFLDAPSQTISKIKQVQRLVERIDNVLLWWRPMKLNAVAIKYVGNMFSKEYTEYMNIIEESKEHMSIICDETDLVSRAIALSDAYYGDEGEVMECYQKTGKPIMIQNYEIVGY